MRHLFDCWADVAERLKGKQTIGLFLDFDGTLAPIADHPAHAHMPEATRQIVDRLAKSPRVRVTIISGRDYDSLQQAVGLPSVRCLGLYGWEGPDKVRLDPEAALALDVACAQLAKRLGQMEGVWIEKKSRAFAVHYRGSTEAVAGETGMIVNEVMEPYRATLWVMPAKKAWEVLPQSIRGKGEALHRELTNHPAELAIYAGDDLSDEAAFLAMSGSDISIHIGMRERSQAQFRLSDPDEVRQFLERLEGLVGARSL